MGVLDLVAKLSLDSSDYDSGLGKAKSIAGTAGTAIAVGIGAATSAVTAFAGASVKTGSDFDKSMSQVAATMGLTMDEMSTEVGSVDTAFGTFSGNLREYAQFMGQNTAFSASQAADALNYMALAGYDAQTSMSMLPNVLNLAAAGNFDLARASDMVTDTQTAFGISLERTNQMVDEMAKAASTGNTSVEQLGDAFLVVGGLAQELNGGMVTLADGTQQPVDGLQELEIALTAMANAGVKGSEAGTHMRNMLLKLSDPTDDGVAALERMGVTVFDTEGKMRSLSDIFGDLSNELDNMSQEEKIQTIADLFNTRDLASAEALLNAVGQDWDSIGESILNADGAAQQMADTQLDNLAGDMTLFQSALEGAQIAISDVLTPSLREFVQFGTDGLSQLTSAFQEGGLTGAMGVFGTLLSDGLNMIIEMLPTAIDAGMQLIGAFGQGIIDNIPTLVDASIQIMNQLVDGIITALPALATGAVQIIVGLANGIAKALPQLVPAVVQVIAQIATLIVDNLPLILEAGMNILEGLVEGILEALPVLIEALPELIESIVNFLVESLPILIEGAIEIINAVIEALPEILQALIDALPTIIQTVITALIENLPIIIDGIVQLVLAVVQAFPQIMTALYQALPTIVQTIASTLVENYPTILDGIGQVITQIATQLPTIAMAIVEAIPTIFVACVDALITSIPLIIQAIIDMTTQMIETFNSIDWQKLGSDVITFIVEGITSLVEDIPQALLDIGNQAIEWVTAIDWIQLGKDVIDAIVEGIDFLVNDIPDALESIAEGAVSAVKDIDWLDLGKNIVDGIASGITGAASVVIDVISDLCESAWESVKSFFGIASPSKLMRWAGRMIDEGFADGIIKNLDTVEDAMDELNATAMIDASNYLGNTDGLTPALEGAGYSQVVNIYAPTELDPSEVARQTRNATRDMVLELRGKR